MSFAPYTRELIALGVKDTMARRDEVRAFFAWQDVHAPHPPVAIRACPMP